MNPNLSKTNDYFPKSMFITFDAANPAQIVGKLKSKFGNIQVTEFDSKGFDP